ncbi:LOW QUALITY PROTEIN: hypothetical protein PHMEG_00023808 [Phytophthora megakarya]|uniref:Retrotransposon gag domain-containing protein n=1 Tax=Phytophthora megakarya TaxID=4795 RepID=A0A225VFZ3_9STRA|nr:LOW QUALITY PROTEIN: hypothetical protein PHMEG_00023808 [Phytophthora megakarya]
MVTQQRMQESVQCQQQQVQQFMVQHASFQTEMFAQLSRANQKNQRANPPKFMGKSDEDLELWIFQIEEHFSGYSNVRVTIRGSLTSWFHFFGPNVMSWYQELKASIGETPRRWTLFKEQIRSRFRDSDFEFKLLIKMYDLQATVMQQEYTSKFMLLLSQLVDMPEVVKR